MELAVESGNEGTAKLLRGVIEVDEDTGTARLRSGVAAADEMALDARSTRRPPGCGRRPDAHLHGRPCDGGRDYCDVCGSPIVTAPGAQTSLVGPDRRNACPACQAPVAGRFCEACGHDSALPVPTRSRSRRRSRRMDRGRHRRPDYYKRVIARGGPDTVEFPELFPERRILLRDNTLIGRRNRKPRASSRGSTWASIPSTAACPHNMRSCGCETRADDHRSGVDQRNQHQRQRRSIEATARKPR